MGLRIELVFPADDEKWMRLEKIQLPDFFAGHGQAPVIGDVLRFGHRQFVVGGRLWEQDGESTVLRVFVGAAHAESDTVFG